MSDLPKYERIPGMDHLDVELGHGHDHSVAAGTGAGTGSTSTSRQAVTSYSFYPVYPQRGKDQHVVGIQGATRDETIDLIYRYFPQLSSIPSSRITLSVPRSLNVTIDAMQPLQPNLPHGHNLSHNINFPQSHVLSFAQSHTITQSYPPQRITATNDGSGQWAKVSDDAWEGLRGDGLRCVRVDVEDGPGDKRRRNLYYIAAVSAPVLGVLAFGIIMLLLISTLVDE